MRLKKLKLKRWQIISLVALFLLALLLNVFAWYFERNTAYVNIWFQRLKGDQVFYLEGLEIKVPKNCAIYPSSDMKEALILFRCATTPDKYEHVVIRRSGVVDNEGLQELKKCAEDFVEFDEYVYMVMRPKPNDFSLYYLKRQNIIVFSDSQELAKTFADLLVKYDFRVESTPLEAKKEGQVLYLEGLEIKLPKDCVIRPSDRHPKAIVSLFCEIAPDEMDILVLYKSPAIDNESLQNAKKSAHEFVEFDDYIYMLVGKRRESASHMYHLKRQNVLVSSMSQGLAKKFADLLVKYDFRVESMPVEANPDAQ
jgi:hypothetical protein